MWWTWRKGEQKQLHSANMFCFPGSTIADSVLVALTWKILSFAPVFKVATESADTHTHTPPPSPPPPHTSTTTTPKKINQERTFNFTNKSRSWELKVRKISFCKMCYFPLYLGYVSGWYYSDCKGFLTFSVWSQIAHFRSQLGLEQKGNPVWTFFSSFFLFTSSGTNNPGKGKSSMTSF